MARKQNMGGPLVELVWRMALTVLTAFVSFVVTLLLQYRYQRWLSWRLRQQAEKHEKQHGQKEAALVVSVLHDIQEAVRAYLAKDGKQDMPLLKVHQAAGFGAKEEEWLAYVEKVKAVIRQVRAEGFVRVYVFTNVPLAEALLIGATLTNGPEAVIHQFSSGVYLPVGRLNVETIRL
jgi:hypothetical protein